jgi:hypothetical protein
MATVTPTYSWPVPTSTDYVADGAVAIEALGDAVDATVGTAFNNKLHPGLVLIKSQAITTGVSLVTITSAFSATYDAYKIVVSGLTTSAPTGIGIQMGTSNTGYYGGNLVTAAYTTSSGNVVFSNFANLGSYDIGIVATTTNQTGGSFELQNPFAASTTSIQGFGSDPRTTDYSLRFNAGFHNVATSYTSFTILTAAPTFTAGRVSVYGYAKD